LETTDLEQLLRDSMAEGMRLVQAVDQAEASQERLERDLHAAMERTQLARRRYDQNRELVASIWETLKEEITADKASRTVEMADGRT
jgi:predicted glycosyltransferase